MTVSEPYFSGVRVCGCDEFVEIIWHTRLWFLSADKHLSQLITSRVVDIQIQLDEIGSSDKRSIYQVTPFVHSECI